MKMITIEEWVSEEKKRLDRFADMFRDGQQKIPDLFPNKLPSGEWDEQYRIYDE
jgi:hypothetical protein